MPPRKLTEAQYWSEVQLLSTEIEAAVIIFHTYEEINRLAVHDKAIVNALFWRTQMHCLQTSLFVTLSRIFDRNTDAHTIHKLINATLNNLDLFSEAALKARKGDGGTKPVWLDSFMAKAWIPTSPKDIRHLKTALAPHTKRFERVYLPIRHAIFAHRLMSDDEASVQLFGSTSRDEVGATLDVLHDLIDVIVNLYTNGLKPELGKRDFKAHNQRIRDGVSEALKHLF